MPLGRHPDFDESYEAGYARCLACNHCFRAQGGAADWREHARDASTSDLVELGNAWRKRCRSEAEKFARAMEGRW